jgi:hypothetical protein
MKRSTIGILSLFSTSLLIGQGLINNGARIVLTNGSNVYIDGATGHYTSQSGGAITNNTAGGTITLLGNWINNSANSGFTNDGATVVLAGANETIGGSNSTSFYNLSLAGTGTKSLLINTTVGGQATYTGILALGSRPLDLNGFRLDVTNSAAGAITYGAGYIQSETNAGVNPSIVRWYHGTTMGAHVYPFGVAASQLPFTFNITTPMAAATDYVDVSTRSTAINDNLPWAGASNVAAVSQMFSPIIGGAGEIPVVVDRWWDITTSSPVTADVTFSYRGSENTLMAPYNVGNLGAQHWNGAGWDPPVGTAAAVLAGVGAVTAAGLNTFSPWVLSSVAAPLPIGLIDFNAMCTNNSVTLNWATATEKYNDYFTVLKSYDAQHYEAIAAVKGAGTSYTNKKYSYTDANARPGEIIYYKLKQTDFGGQSKTFDPISTETCKTGKNTIEVINTIEGKIVVSYLIDQSGEYTVSLFDVLGRTMKSEKQLLSKGFTISELETGDLPEACYTLLITGNADQKIQKVYIRE